MITIAFLPSLQIVVALVAAVFFVQVNLLLCQLIRDKLGGENGFLSGMILANFGLWIAGLINIYEASYRLFYANFNWSDVVPGLIRILIFLFLILGFHKTYYGLKVTNDSYNDTKGTPGPDAD